MPTVEKAIQPVVEICQSEESWIIADQISSLEATVRKRDETIQSLNDNKIHASRSWRVLDACSRLLNWILPRGSQRRNVIRQFVRGVWNRWRWLIGKYQAGTTSFSAKAYAQWIAENEPSIEDLGQQRKLRLARSPRISLVVPVYNPPVVYLRAMLDSVLAQTCENWEICLADGASPAAEVAQVLEEYARRDARIRLALLPENRGIAGNSIAALELVSGDYIAFLDHDDTLAPFALFEVVRALNDEPELDFIYSDEDHLNENGNREHPHFKPDWSPDTLRSHNYICHLVVIRRDLLERVGGLREGFDGSQDHDLVLRATERASHIYHIPKILYHWRQHRASMSKGAGKNEAHQAGKKAVREHLARQAIAGSVIDGVSPHTYDVRRSLLRRPMVSIIIPTQDQVGILDRCLESIARSTYTNYEILLVENQSRCPKTFAYYRTLERRPEIRLIPWNDHSNYSKLNNFAVTQTRGEVLLLLNNNTQARNPDWLERMLEHAMQPEVGAVGAKLFYPDGDIQHGGIILGIGGVAGHAHRYFSGSSAGYLHRLVVTQNMSAITGACLMLRKEVFEEAGGFDERLAIVFNDVDLCMRIRRKGYWIVWTPFAMLTHYESRMRGMNDTLEKQCRFNEESQIFADTWHDALREGDPFYSPHLTLSSENFALRLQSQNKSAFPLKRPPAQQ
ncbi:MAG: glycosyltransferase family 2 protein [Planctomycetota bacterium]